MGSLPPRSSSSRTLRTWPVEQLARLAITPSGSSGLRRSSNSSSAWRREAQPSPFAPMVAFSTAFSRWQCRQSHWPPCLVQPSGRRGTVLAAGGVAHGHLAAGTGPPAGAGRVGARCVAVVVLDMSYLRGLERCFAKAAYQWKNCAKMLQMPGFHGPAGSYMLADAEIPAKRGFWPNRFHASVTQRTGRTATNTAPRDAPGRQSQLDASPRDRPGR